MWSNRSSGRTGLFRGALDGRARSSHELIDSSLIRPTTTITDGLGYFAATLTTASFIPQAWLTFRSRDVSGISLGMYAAFTLGIALWLGYGVMLQAWPIVIANSITFLLAAAILAMKLTIGRSSR